MRPNRKGEGKERGYCSKRQASMGCPSKSLLLKALPRFPRRAPPAISFARRVRVGTAHLRVLGCGIGVWWGEVRGVGDGDRLGCRGGGSGVEVGLGFPANGARGREASGGGGGVVLRSISCGSKASVQAPRENGKDSRVETVPASLPRLPGSVLLRLTFAFPPSPLFLNLLLSTLFSLPFRLSSVAPLPLASLALGPTLPPGIPYPLSPSIPLRSFFFASGIGGSSPRTKCACCSIKNSSTSFALPCSPAPCAAAPPTGICPPGNPGNPNNAPSDAPSRRVLTSPGWKTTARFEAVMRFEAEEREKTERKSRR